jgi:hypothetical protein
MSVRTRVVAPPPHTHTYMHTYTHTRAHAHTLTHSHTHTRHARTLHTLTHTHTHSYAHAHTRTLLAHTHTLNRPASWTVQKKMGSGFEEVARQKNGGNPEFSFLFGGPGSDYYQWHSYTKRNNFSEADIEKFVIQAELKREVGVPAVCTCGVSTLMCLGCVSARRWTRGCVARAPPSLRHLCLLPQGFASKPLTQDEMNEVRSHCSAQRALVGADGCGVCVCALRDPLPCRARLGPCSGRPPPPHTHTHMILFFAFFSWQPA